MTARERAEAVLAKRGDDVAAFLRGGRECPGNVVEYVTGAIASAEAAAYERAAKEIDGLAEKTRNKGRQDTLWVAADAVRALATKEATR